MYAMEFHEIMVTVWYCIVYGTDDINRFRMLVIYILFCTKLLGATKMILTFIYGLWSGNIRFNFNYGCTIWDGRSVMEPVQYLVKW